MVAGTGSPHAHAPPEVSADDVTAVPLNTRRSTSWATNTWDAWARETASMPGGRSAPTADQLTRVSAVDFNDALCRFVTETRRGNGDPYPPKSVYLLCTGLLRFVRNSCCRPDLNMFDQTSDVFGDFRRTLEKRMMQLTEMGIGAVSRHWQPITAEQEHILWEKELLGTRDAETLVRTVYFYNSKAFGLRSREEHRALDVTQFKLRQDEFGRYVVFQPQSIHNGASYRKSSAVKVTRQYDEEGNHRSVYKLLRLYLTLVPTSGPFYRKPLRARCASRLCFRAQPVGAQTLASYIPDMMKRAGFIGYYSGKSEKATQEKTLFRNGAGDGLKTDCRNGVTSPAARATKRTVEIQTKSVKRVSDLPRYPVALTTPPMVVDNGDVTRPAFYINEMTTKVRECHLEPEMTKWQNTPETLDFRRSPEVLVADDWCNSSLCQTTSSDDEASSDAHTLLSDNHRYAHKKFRYQRRSVDAIDA